MIYHKKCDDLRDCLGCRSSVYSGPGSLALYLAINGGQLKRKDLLPYSAVSSIHGKLWSHIFVSNVYSEYCQIVSVVVRLYTILRRRRRLTTNGEMKPRGRAIK